jgi:small-conductance mechanosensitive channel
MAAGRRTRRSLLDAPHRLTIGPERSPNPPYPACVSWLDHPSARAGVTVLITVGAAALLDGVLQRQVGKLMRRLPGDAAAIRTRWRVLRRLAVLCVIVVGVASAALNFPETRLAASAALSSAAVLAVIIGFAAQSTLSNLVAGLVLALSQPIRLGDRVRVDERDGVVEEIGLTFTYLRGDDGRRIVYPNSLLAASALENETIRDQAGRAEVVVEVELGDLARMRERLATAAADAGLEHAEVAITDVTSSSATLAVRGWSASWPDVRRAEERLRLAAAEILAPEPSEAPA